MLQACSRGHWRVAHADHHNSLGAGLIEDQIGKRGHDDPAQPWNVGALSGVGMTCDEVDCRPDPLLPLFAPCGDCSRIRPRTPSSSTRACGVNSSFKGRVSPDLRHRGIASELAAGRLIKGEFEGGDVILGQSDWRRLVPMIARTIRAISSARPQDVVSRPALPCRATFPSADEIPFASAREAQ